MVSEILLKNIGAWRVHGGGFGGTIQAFVPENMLNKYRAVIQSVFGADSCYVLKVRNSGGIKLS